MSLLERITLGCKSSPTKQAIIEDDEGQTALHLKQMGYVKLTLPTKFNVSSCRRNNVRYVAELRDIL